MAAAPFKGHHQDWINPLLAHCRFFRKPRSLEARCYTVLSITFCKKPAWRKGVVLQKLRKALPDSKMAFNTRKSLILRLTVGKSSGFRPWKIHFPPRFGVAILFSFQFVFAQEALTNESVLRLVRAGMSEDVITSMISSRP